MASTQVAHRPPWAITRMHAVLATPCICPALAHATRPTIRFHGNEYFADGRLRKYDIEAQARAVFSAMSAQYWPPAARWEDLVDVTVYLTDMARDFKAYNAVWAEHFPDAASAPCRTTLGITALPTPIAIELKCIARIED